MLIVLRNLQITQKSYLRVRVSFVDGVSKFVSIYRLLEHLFIFLAIHAYSVRLTSLFLYILLLLFFLFICLNFFPFRATMDHVILNSAKLSSSNTIFLNYKCDDG